MYLSGPITNIPALNKPAFSAAAIYLRAAGFEVINPHDLAPSTSSWRAAMRACIAELARSADIVLMLDGWADSRGATIERQLAENLGIPVYYSMEGLCQNRPA